MSGKPVLSVQVSPYLVTSSARHSVQTVTVSDKGSAPLAITAGFRSLQNAGRGCRMAVPPSWVTASPARFTLHPGQSRNVTLTVAAPATATGHYDLLAVMSAVPATPAHAAMGETVGGAVSTRVLLSYPGATTAEPCATLTPRVQAAAPHQAGINPLAGILGLVFILAVIAAAAVVIRHRIARR